MEKIIIDENYEGLVKRNNYYYIEKIELNCNVEIKINLEVGDSLKVGGWLEVGGWLKVGDSLKVGDWLKVGDSLKVGGWLEVGDSLKVRGWLEVGEFKKILNLKTKYCVLIHLEYYIILLENHIKIGCKLYSKEQWGNFSDKEILEMDGKKGLNFWKKNKEWLLSYNHVNQ